MSGQAAMAGDDQFMLILSVIAVIIIVLFVCDPDYSVLWNWTGKVKWPWKH